MPQVGAWDTLSPWPRLPSEPSGTVADRLTSRWPFHCGQDLHATVRASKDETLLTPPDDSWGRIEGRDPTG